MGQQWRKVRGFGILRRLGTPTVACCATPTMMTRRCTSLQLARGKLPRAWEEHETPEQERADTVMMGLRLTAGLDRQAFEARFGRTFEFFYGMQLAEMEREGLMGRSGNAVFLTERGLLLSNYVLAHFI